MYPDEAEAPDGRGVRRRRRCATPTRRPRAATGRDPEFLDDVVRAEPAAASTRSSPTSTATAGSSAPSSRRTARATCSTTSGDVVADVDHREAAWPRCDAARGRRAAATARTASEPRRRPGPPDGHPPGKGHALRRLPLRAGRPRQHQALRRSAGGDRDPVHRLPRHGHARRRRCGPPARRRTRPTPDGQAGRDLDGAAHAVRASGGSSGSGDKLDPELDGREGPELGGRRRRRTRSTPAHRALQREVGTWPRRCASTPTARSSGATCPAAGETPCAHANEQHELHRLPLVVEPELLRLPPAAEGEQEDAAACTTRATSRATTSSYNFQTLRDDVYMLARDGDVTGNRIGPARSSCAVHVGSYNDNRESIYVQQQTISGGGLSRHRLQHERAAHGPRRQQAHTQSAPPARAKRRCCTDCHVSQEQRQQRHHGPAPDAGHELRELHGPLLLGRRRRARPVRRSSSPSATSRRRSSAARCTSSPSRTTTRSTSSTSGELEHAHEHPGKDIGEQLLQPLEQGRDPAGAGPRRVPLRGLRRGRRCASSTSPSSTTRASPSGSRRRRCRRSASSSMCRRSTPRPSPRRRRSAPDPTRTQRPENQRAGGPPAVRLHLRRRQVRGADPGRRRHAARRQPAQQLPRARA